MTKKELIEILQDVDDDARVCTTWGGQFFEMGYGIETYENESYLDLYDEPQTGNIIVL